MNIGFALCFSFVQRNVYEQISSQSSHFIPVENIRKSIGFLMFTEGIKREHWRGECVSISPV